MKITITPENFMEWFAKKANLAPMPLVETQITFTAARSIMAGAELGIYEALGKNKKSAQEVAQYCRTHIEGTRHLLDCLVGIGYLHYDNGKYSLKRKYYKWLLKEYESNMIGKLRFQIYEWDYMSKLEEYVRTGKSLELHSMTNKAEWESYQEGMRDLSVNAAKELAKKIPVPSGATQMLDIGGSHGLYSIELCRKYKTLNSTVLELPGAVEAASAIAKRYDDTNRVNYKSGNALQDNLGSDLYDVVMINNVVHHFTAEQNRMVAKKIAAALKTNGIFVVGEIMRNDKPGEGGVVGATTGLYFSLTSYSGTWSQPEVESWMSEAGLKVEKPVVPMTLPGFKMMIGRKK
jgi:2-polyprenyl-3-methyl-5-hydroxy-6-metoxy-1,4-benzoquinol methylase